MSTPLIRCFCLLSLRIASWASPSVYLTRSLTKACVIVAMLVLSFVSEAHATVIYEYHGIPFTYFQAPYTGADYVSGTMTLIKLIRWGPT